MKARPKLLDLFCKAGGTSAGYDQAGFEVVGVDIAHQKNYPFEFYQADWLEFVIANYWKFDVIAASPPCQEYSRMAHLATREYPKLVGDVRDVLKWTGKPFVIENVVGAPLVTPLMLCGSMFAGLRVYRHRLFECNPIIWWSPSVCAHRARKGRKPGMYKYDASGKRVLASFANSDVLTITGNGYKLPDGRLAMGIGWMTRAELSQAIPPAYTEYVGKEMIKILWK